MINDQEINDNVPIYEFVANLTRFFGRLFTLKQHEHIIQLVLDSRSVPTGNPSDAGANVDDPMEFNAMNQGR